MRVTCPSCQTNYNIDDKRVPPGGAKLKCAKCQTTFPIRAGGAAEGAVPLPGSGAPAGGGAIPLPGSGPAAASGGAIPLPGSGHAAASGGAIPLPGAGGGFGAPADAPPHWDTDSTRVMTMPVPAEAYGRAPAAPGGAIPLPGAADFGEPPTASDDDVGFADADLVDAPPRGGAIPLPGSASTRAPAGSIPLPGGARSPAAAGAVPLPGGADFGDPGAVPLPGADSFGGAASDSIPLPASAGYAAPPPPSDGFAIDFGEPPPQAQAAPPLPDFSEDLPSPSGVDFSAPPPAADFAFPPPEPEPTRAPAAMDFSENLPSPAAPQDFNVDFSDAPPPPPAPAAAPARAAAPPPQDIGFGEVDFGEPAPSAPAGGHDPLEFDPTSSRAAKDDLEADLSAPIPAPPPPSSADGLEMLNFIDDAAKDTGGKAAKAKRFHVRRRSGKVFGPFDEGVVVKMLEDGQLLGNEDVSTDGEAWSPMATIPSFGQAIAKLMESGAPAGAAGGADAASVAQTAQSMDRLKQLYEGRMAAIAIVDRRESSEKLRRRLPLYIAAGVIAVVGLSGGSLAFTRYGAFGTKLLFPATLSASSPQFASLQAAKKALLTDTFKSYQEARDLTAKILAVKEYPEARAVWTQAIFYLQRRYAAATPAEQQQARDALPDIELLGMRNVEVAKAFVGSHLAAKNPQAALPLLLEAKSRAENDGDLELELLLAEAHFAKGDVKTAEDVLKKVLAKEKSSAKALHALGNVRQANNDAAGAGQAYAAALAADPEHVASAVEFAAVEILVNRDMADGEASLRKALAPEVQKMMGPAEQGRAKALNGVLLASRFEAEAASKELDAAAKLDPDSVFTKAMLGRVLLGRREFERALPLYKEASEREPQNLEYAEGYLQTLIATGRMNDALNAVQAANARFPGNGRIAYLFGTVSDALDNAADAEGHYKRAISADPELFEANLALGRFYLRFRRNTDARPQMEAAATKKPEDASVNAGLGELALAEDDVDGAAKAFQRSAELNPNLADAYLGLARVALRRNDPEGALKAADKAIELDANLRGPRLQRALALWRLGKLDDAIAELGRAQQADPKSARIAVTMGAVKYDKGDLAGAEAALTTALTMEPSNHEAHFHMARVKSRRAEHTQAIDSMRTAIEHAPKRPDYHYEMGLIYRDAKKFTEAIEQWRITAQLDPMHADALEALGQQLLDQGDVDGAVAAFDQALKADPRRTRIMGLVGDAYFQAAKWDQAISRYQSALKADRSLVHLYYRMGRAYSEKGQGAKALGYYQLAAQRDADNAMPYYYLAFAYKERGKKVEAITAFKNYLKRKPDADDKKEIEDEIYDLEH